MKKSKVIGLNPEKMKQQMMKLVVDEQSVRLAEYAKEKIREIGERIQEYHSVNHMDRTGHLLDSLCWGVAYRGDLKYSGFYRERSARHPSFLHEWMGDLQEPVDGRGLAQNYIDTYGHNTTNGWKVFFAILAPYWGYWEKGFTMRMPSSPDDEEDAVNVRHLQFSVMTEFYDMVKRDLKPTRVRLRVSVPKYNFRKKIKTYERKEKAKPYVPRRYRSLI